MNTPCFLHGVSCRGLKAQLVDDILRVLDTCPLPRMVLGIVVPMRLTWSHRVCTFTVRSTRAKDGRGPPRHPANDPASHTQRAPHKRNEKPLNNQESEPKQKAELVQHKRASRQRLAVPRKDNHQGVLEEARPPQWAETRPLFRTDSTARQGEKFAVSARSQSDTKPRPERLCVVQPVSQPASDPEGVGQNLGVHALHSP